MKNINIPTTSRLFFRQFLELVKSIKPFNTLNKRELDVLGELLHFNNLYSSLEYKSRKLIIFSTETRKEIRESLNITQDTFNTNLSHLRAKKIIDKDNNFVSSLQDLFFDGELILQFKFKDAK